MLLHYIMLICSSKAYRSIKLFFIGKEGRGKTTLKKRLSNRTISGKEIKTTQSTIGIDVDVWEYKPKKAGREPVKFLTWDFAGQVSAKKAVGISIRS